MFLFSTISLSIALGLLIGFSVKYVFGQSFQPMNVMALKSNYTEMIPKNSNPIFDTLEIRILERFISENSNKKISVEVANQILRYKNLSKENQRQRRYILIKELNLKLNILFQLSDCII